jgi:hypothetical protein
MVYAGNHYYLLYHLNSIVGVDTIMNYHRLYEVNHLIQVSKPPKAFEIFQKIIARIISKRYKCISLYNDIL